MVLMQQVQAWFQPQNHQPLYEFPFLHGTIVDSWLENQTFVRGSTAPIIWMQLCDIIFFGKKLQAP